MCCMVASSILTEINFNIIFENKIFPDHLEQKLNSMKLFDMNSLIKDIYHQKDFIKNDTLLTMVLFDCFKIILFIYNYEFSFNKDILSNKYKEQLNSFHIKFVKHS